MHATEQSILNKFKREPMREISTTELAQESQPHIFSQVNNDFYNSDRKKSAAAKRLKGALHRKTLYHLNNLVREGILKVTSIHGKGEKYFSLSIDQGELTVKKKHRQIIINKPSISTNLIDEYEQKGIIQKFDAQGWTSQLNCILLDCGKYTDIMQAHQQAYNILPEINDCIGLDNFEQLINLSLPEIASIFARKIELDAREHDRIINFIVHTSKIRDDTKFLDFIRSFAEIKPKNTSLIFISDSKGIKEKANLFALLAQEFMDAEIKFNFQNSSAKKAPILIGKAGTYTINDTEWQTYISEHREKSSGLSIANLSIVIDVNRFYREGLSSSAFRDLVMKVSKTLLRVNASQMRSSSESFKRIKELNPKQVKKFFAFQKSYIRFWNYDFKDKKHENFPELIESCKAEAEKFCREERAIYNACGLPTNFDIVFSSTISKFHNSLTTRNYAKTTIRSIKDYDEPENSRFIANKEKLAKIMLGGDRCRFFRKGDFSPDSFARELNFLISNYDLPLITYDFKETNSEMKLTSFLMAEDEA